jgi:hypothetical protein
VKINLPCLFSVQRKKNETPSWSGIFDTKLPTTISFTIMDSEPLGQSDYYPENKSIEIDF